MTHFDLPVGHPIKSNSRLWGNASKRPRLDIQIPVSISDISLSKAIKELQEALSSVPEQYRDSATMHVDLEWSGEDASTRTFIFYQRDEAPEKREVREKEDHRQQRLAEARDRRRYEELKARFDGEVSP